MFRNRPLPLQASLYKPEIFWDIHVGMNYTEGAKKCINILGIEYCDFNTGFFHFLETCIPF